MASSSNNNTPAPTWQCRECLAGGTTYNSSTASNMKSHLATHGYGPFRCTGCNYLGRRKEDIISHHRASGETGQDAGWYNDPALNDRVNLEVKACRLPHRAPWTGSSVVPPPDQTTLAAARASISQSTPDEEDDDEHDEHDVPMPLPGIIAEAVNAIMPMIGHLYYRGDYQQNPNLKMWVDELQVRLDRIEDAQSFQEAVLRLQRLKGTVELGRNLLTTNRELLAFEATVQKIEELARDADREH